MNAIGYLELNGTARGILAADECLKAADVSLIKSHINCPGKYEILISGEVSDVEAALKNGKAAGGDRLLKDLILPNIHPQVTERLTKRLVPEHLLALGILEFNTMTAAVAAADAAVKAADITLLEVHLGIMYGGKSFLLFTGDVAATEAAADAGVSAADGLGHLIDRVVIAHPDESLKKSLFR